MLRIERESLFLLEIIWNTFFGDTEFEWDTTNTVQAPKY